MKELVKLNHLDKHFILYSKEHYKRFNEPIVDLCKIVDKSCALSDGYTKPYTIYLELYKTFILVADGWMLNDFFKRLFCKFGTLEVINIDYVYATELMLGLLGNLTVRDNEGEYIWDIGRADPEVWPVEARMLKRYKEQDNE